MYQPAAKSWLNLCNQRLNASLQIRRYVPRMAYLKIVDKTLAQLSDTDRRLVTREQLLEHGRVIYSSVIGNIIAGAILTFIFFADIPPAMLALWWAIYVINTVDRVMLKARTRAASDNAEQA